MTDKGKFLKKFNEAFAEKNTQYILEHLTEDISWELIGSRILQGRPAVEEALRDMALIETLNMEVLKIITEGNSGSVNGRMRIREFSGEIKNFGFCDIYDFSSSYNFKIRKMTSYVVEIIIEEP